MRYLMSNGTNKIFNVIHGCRVFLKWLHREDVVEIKQMPEEYKTDCKKLLDLGIVYKRNNRTLGIRWQRLRRLVERNGESVPYDADELLSYICRPALSASV